MGFLFDLENLENVSYKTKFSKPNENSINITANKTINF